MGKHNRLLLVHIITMFNAHRLEKQALPSVILAELYLNAILPTSSWLSSRPMLSVNKHCNSKNQMKIHQKSTLCSILTQVHRCLPLVTPNTHSWPS